MAFSYGWRGPNIVKDGLILYLDAGSPNSFYPLTAGTTWKDISGLTNNGTLTNGPTFSSDNGGSIILDGIDDYVDTGASSAGSATSSFTFGGWFKPIAGQDNLILVRGVDGFGSGWSTLLRWDKTTLKINVALVTTSPSTNSYGLEGITNFPAGTWTHAFGIWNAGVSISLYCNGQLENTVSNTTTQLRGSTRGWQSGRIASSVYGKANVANLQVYNRVLSPTEILQNYNATKTRFGL